MSSGTGLRSATSGTRLQRPFLSDFFIAAGLLTRQEEFTKPDFALLARAFNRGIMGPPSIDRNQSQPLVTPAEAGVHCLSKSQWVPAFAGTTWLSRDGGPPLVAQTAQSTRSVPSAPPFLADGLGPSPGPSKGLEGSGPTQGGPSPASSGASPLWLAAESLSAVRQLAPVAGRYSRTQ